MPVQVSFEEPSRFVVNTSGRVTLAEVMRAMDGILDDARLQPGAMLLAIARGVTETPATHEIREIAVACKSLMDRGVSGIAIVTPSGFVFGVARMFTAFAELAGVRAEVFLDVADAQRWLDEAAT